MRWGQGGRQRERGDAARNRSMCQRHHAGFILEGVELTQSSLTLNNVVGVRTFRDRDEGRVEQEGMRYTQGRALTTFLSNVICTDPGISGAKGRTQK